MDTNNGKTRQRIDVIKNATASDEVVDASLRPTTFEDYIGQREVIDNLRLSVIAAARGGWSFDHQLFTGPAGVGKTSIAKVIAGELGVDMREASAPCIRHKGELISLLTALREGDVLFIDEIHRLPQTLQEILYGAMEDFALDITTAEGKVIRMPLPKFTLIGATTHAGMLTGPIRDRFGFVWQLTTYTNDELATIVQRSAKKLAIFCDPNGAAEIARRSRGVPRIANRLLRRVRDFAMIAASEGALVPTRDMFASTRAKATINGALAAYALDKLGIDSLGLERDDLTCLQYLVKASSPVGIEALAAALGMPRQTIEDVIEPYLLKLGLIERTPRGRLATAAGVSHAKAARAVAS